MKYIHANRVVWQDGLKVPWYKQITHINMYRLHHEVEVGMGFTQPRAEGPRIV